MTCPPSWTPAAAGWCSAGWPPGARCWPRLPRPTSSRPTSSPAPPSIALSRAHSWPPPRRPEPRAPDSGDQRTSLLVVAHDRVGAVDPGLLAAAAKVGFELLGMLGGNDAPTQTVHQVTAQPA